MTVQQKIVKGRGNVVLVLFAYRGVFSVVGASMIVSMRKPFVWSFCALIVRGRPLSYLSR